MKKIKREHIILWFIIFIFSIIMCFSFIQPHYAHDTYEVITNGIYNYGEDRFLKNGRPISDILAIWVGILNVPIEACILASFFIGIAFLSIAVVVLYKIFEEHFEGLSNVKKVMLILISYIFIFSYLSIENIFFLETGVVCLGVLLSVLASKIMIERNKNFLIKSFLVLLLGCFCYQCTISIFPMVILAYYAIFEQKTFKEYVKIAFQATIFYGICMLVNILFIRFVNPTGARIDVQFEVTNIFSMETVEWIKYLVIDSLNVILPYVHLGIILLTMFFELISKRNLKEKIYRIFLYCIIILASIVMSIVPILFSDNFNLEPRMCTAFGYTIGISLLFILQTNYKSGKKDFKNIFIYSIIILVFTLNTILYMILTIQHIYVNKKDQKIGERIAQEVEKYESETGIILSEIYTVHNKDKTDYINEGFIPVTSYNQPASSSWAAVCMVWKYTHHMEHKGRLELNTFINNYHVEYNQFLDSRVYFDTDKLFLYVY